MAVKIMLHRSEEHASIPDMTCRPDAGQWKWVWRKFHAAPHSYPIASPYSIPSFLGLEDRVACRLTVEGEGEDDDGESTSAAKIITKKCLYKRSVLVHVLCKNDKTIILQANSLACSLANGDTPVAATLQRNSSGGVLLVKIQRLLLEWPRRTGIRPIL